MLLLMLSVVVNCVGVRCLLDAKPTYQAFAESIANSPETVVISNVWWVPFVVASVFYERDFLAVSNEADLCS